MEGERSELTGVDAARQAYEDAKAAYEAAEYRDQAAIDSDLYGGDRELEWLHDKVYSTKAAYDRAVSKAESVKPVPQAERYYSTVTGQQAEINPDYVKQHLLAIPENRYYTPDSNEAQQIRAIGRINEQGADAVYDRLMNLENMTADDVADAQVLQAVYFSDKYADPVKALSLASKYAQVGTVQAQGLQARSYIRKMTPAGMQMWLTSHYMPMTQKAMQENAGKVNEAKKQAQKIEENISTEDATDKLEELNQQEAFVLPTSTNNRWHVPLNDRQTALIRQLGLEKVRRIGQFYNHATPEQRILESILRTPDPLAPISEGMNLVEGIELMKSGLPVLLPYDVEYITDRMRAYAKVDENDRDGRVAQLELARAYEAAHNIEPLSMRDKVRSWRYTSMLLSVPSSFRNVLGNGLQNAVNAFAHDLVATNIDKLVAKKTGERTVAGISAAEKAEGWNQFREEIVNVWNDHFVDRAITRPEGVRYGDTSRGRVFNNRAAEAMRTAESFLMSYGDRTFWAMAYSNSMNEQRRLAELNGKEFDPEAASKRASADADYAIFNEDSKLKTAIANFKRNAGVLGDAVDLIIPFTGVPTNITRRMIQYSPIGLAQTVIRHGVRQMQGRSFDQVDFVNGMARGLTGTAAFAAGMALYALGAIKLGTAGEDDKKKAGLEAALGDQYSATISVFGQNVNLSAFAPAVSPLMMGAAAAEIFQDNEDWVQALFSASVAAGDQIFDASYFSSLKDFFSGDGSMVENAALAIANNAVSQMVPSVISQIAAFADPYVRDTNDKNALMRALKTGVMNKIPGLRGMLPEKVDVAGRPVQNTKQGFSSFLNPFSATIQDDDPVMRDMLAVADEIGDSSFLPADVKGFSLNKVKYDLTMDRADHTEFMKRYGSAWHEAAQEIDTTGMTAEQRAKAYGDATSKALADAKLWWANEHGQTDAALTQLPQIFQDAADESYMTRSLEMFEETGSTTYLPGPQENFSQTKKGVKTDYTVPAELWDEYCEEYGRVYAKEMGRISDDAWASMPTDKKQKAIKDARSAANDAAKKWYLKRQ